ncbi:MAG: nitroreductase [Acinetobacter sp.]|jgi:nitroreductase|nr:MAG: nitroreductase [Acinetobacter sp.]
MQECSVENIVALIHERQSIGQLVEPAPSAEQLHQVIASALTAPDHHRLHPWRFICVEHEQRQAFGALLAQSLAADGEMDEVQLERVKLHPLRAPMLLICIMQYHPHPKVPEYEQVLSCGAAIQNILLTLQAQGFASMWRSGAVAESVSLKQALGCAEQDQIAGLIYIGTTAKAIAPRQQLSVTDFLTTWQA